MNNYIEYYKLTINNNKTGLKLVVGGTGLGKTSSIPQIIKELPIGQKAIYVANRIQLLDQMAMDMKNQQIVTLPRDFDVVKNTLFNDRDAFNKFISDKLFTSHIKSMDLVKFRRTLKVLDEIFQTKQQGYLPRWQEEAGEKQARLILRDIRAAILHAKENSSKNYKALLSHSVVHSLFPYIAFQCQPEAKLLLVTLHKLFYGFFDGTKTINGTHLKDYIIFADEFDFLENDLINLIVRSPQINDPFRFVEFFYREMQRHKWQLETYPVSASREIRDRIEKIMGGIQSLRQKGIRYPEINQFISHDKESFAIFRTSHTVNSKPLYLKQVERAFNIVSKRDPDDELTFNARKLLAPISALSEQILFLFKELEEEDPRTYRGLLQDAYRNTTFPQQISQVSQFPQRSQTQSTRIGALLDAGYSMYDIHDIDNPTDPEEVELRNHAIYTTPEKFIASIAKKNLLFALSATADIPRCVNHFNLEWIGSKEGINLISINEVDQDLIAKANAEKAEKRQNRVYVHNLTSDIIPKEIEKELNSVVQSASNLPDFGNDTQGGHLKQRVLLFFTSLFWASEQAVSIDEPQTHLMFLNTYKQIQYFFETEGLSTARLYKISEYNATTLFKAYEIEFNAQTFLVVFYNAEQAKSIRNTAEANGEFNALFHQGLPVVVITQYLSAGNGVNLQYTLPDGRKRDFLNLHILEVPYFYFSSYTEDDTEEEKTAKLKENLWYLAKLHSQKYLSESEFKSKLSTLHKTHEWNNTYQNHERMYADYRLNTLATVIQAIGRIEREWNKTPDQNILLCQEAYQTFQAFLEPEYDDIRTSREKITSNNLQQVLRQISDQTKEQKKTIRRVKDSNLTTVDTASREKIKLILEEFWAIRSGDNLSFRREWTALREAALKHDFADETLKKYRAVFRPPYLHHGELYLTPDNEIIPSNLAQHDTWRWRLNAAYDIVSQNTDIAAYFTSRGYEMDFSLDVKDCFTPYFYQAILSGAIGEEAVKALLESQQFDIEDVPNHLFEVTDLKFAERPWYIDCKNYTDKTMERFALTPEDYGYYPKLSESHFKERAVEKWQQIAQYEGQDTRIIYINLATAHERHLGYYQIANNNLKPVHQFQDSQVIVVQGVLNSQSPNELNQSFKNLIEDLRVNQ